MKVDGKQFSQGGERFHFRGVTYGTFQPRDDGHRYPAPDAVAADFRAIAEAGFTVVRTYTQPSDDVVEQAGHTASSSSPASSTPTGGTW